MDVILTNEVLRDLNDAIALTFVQTTRLTRQDIFDLLPSYPQAYVVVRQAALRMAFSRALTMSARIALRAQSRCSSVLDRGGTVYGLVEIFNLAMLEAEQARAASSGLTAGKVEA